MTPTTRVVLSLVLALGYALPARADFVLIDDGRALFNVRIVDNISTAARPLRVDSRQGFGYVFATDSVYLLPKISGAYHVVDYVTTSVQVGKSDARRFMLAHNWHNYVKPQREVMYMPTPSPTPEVTPVPTATPLPVNVASADLPLADRLQQQKDTFVKEQSKLAADLRTSVSRNQMTEVQATQKRIEWLQAQKNVLEQYYPKDSDLVRDAKVQWDTQINYVQGMGKFDFEQNY